MKYSKLIYHRTFMNNIKIVLMLLEKKKLLIVFRGLKIHNQLFLIPFKLI